MLQVLLSSLRKLSLLKLEYPMTQNQEIERMGSKNSISVEHPYNLSTWKVQARKIKELKASLSYIVSMMPAQVHNTLLKKKKKKVN